MGKPFVHLHVHSEYSMMRGVDSVDALCAAARSRGMDALALTDTNGLYGAVNFVRAARAAGLRPLLGCELLHGGHRAVLLAKSPDGYANLCGLVSLRHMADDFDLVEAVGAHRDGLIVLSDDADALAAWRRVRADDLFLELSPGLDAVRGTDLFRTLAIPPVATNRVHFIDPEGFVIHRLLRAIDLNTTLSRLPEGDTCPPGGWLAPPETVDAAFPHLPEAVGNARRIAGQCFDGWIDGTVHMPRFARATDEDAEAELRRRTYEGAMIRYGAVTPQVEARIEHELSIIAGKRYAHLFLVVEEIVRRSPITCGRGSAAASIVSYCLGLTHVDPLRHHLYFERFLNPGRTDPPDIDIDFPWDERDGLLDWVLSHYGDRAAMVATHQTLALRGAVREVAKVHGMPPADIDRAATLLGRATDIADVTDRASGRARADRLCRRFNLTAPWPDILAQAAAVAGHVRHLAVHAGGVVIVEDDVRRHVPIERAPKGVPVVQWEKDQAEAAGLVKIDLLGNRSLSVIRDTLAAVARHTGRTIDYATWDPLSDDAACELIRRGETMGCFYVESPATRLLLRKLWGRMPADRRRAADVFQYLVIVSSLVRPAAISFVNDLIRRAHGSPYMPLHPLLSEILADTYGIMVYQEDVTKVAIALAGFSLEEADDLRKAISKRPGSRDIADFCARFTRGAQARGVSPEVIDAVWAMIMSFAGYSFCKPHSASYAQVSFRSAYLRAHYPAEFMAAVISNQGGYYSTFAYLSEARRMGLQILPPDVNASDVAYRGAGRAIRVGLMQVKHLTADLAARIVEERTARGSFTSFDDFLARVHPAPAQARQLIKAGCCDSIAGGRSRPALLWRTLSMGRESISPADLPDAPDYDQLTRARHEIEALGLPLAAHPLDFYAAALGKNGVVRAIDMGKWIGQEVEMLGWLVTEKLTNTKRGEPMAFVTFEDTTALYETTVFPDTFRTYAMVLAPDRPYVLRGIVEDDFGAVTLRLRRLRRLDGPIHVGSRIPS